MPQITVTFSNPTYNLNADPALGKTATDIPVETFTKQHAFDSISTATLYIRTDVLSIYSIETADLTNACQLNSTVTVVEGAAYHFRGYVHSKPLYKTFEEGNYLVVECMGWDGILGQALCVDASGNDIWTLESSKYALTNMPLQATAAYGTFQGSTLWPDPDDATGLECYVAGANDVLYTDGVGTVLSAVATTIILTSTTKGFVPRGWIKIDSEWIYFDGYDNSNADTKYRLYNCVRGQLGTSAATHTAPVTVQEKLGKQIAPAALDLQNDPLGGTAWKTVRRGAEFDVHDALGCFVLRDPAAGTYRATCSVYDEDSSLDAASVPISLNDVVTKIMTGTAANFGPGFVAGDLDLSSTTAALKVNRYDYDPQKKQQYAFDAIQELLAAVGLENEIKFWYKHSTGKFRLTVLANDTSSFTLPNTSRVEHEFTLADVYSAIRVEFSDDQNLNRACKTYSWHQAATDSGTSPTAYWGVEKGGASWGWDSHTTVTAAGNDDMQWTCDGKNDSKVGAIWTNENPGASINFADFFFGTGTTPPSIDLDKIKLAVGNYRAIEGWNRSTDNTTFTWVVRVYGCDNYDTTSAATRNASTWVDLGFSMEGTPAAEGSWVEGEALAFAKRRVNAIRLVWDYMPGPKTSGEYYYAVLHDIEILGNLIKYARCQLASTGAGDAAKLVAPASYEKLRGGVKASTGVAGCQRVKSVKLGAASGPAAQSMARILLLTYLRMSEMRRYSYQGVLPGTPELGITIACDEDNDTVVDYTGVLREYSFAIGPVGISEATGTILSTVQAVID